MKKIATLLLICTVSINLLKAQTSGGPDVYGYTWKSSLDLNNPPVYNWIDIVPLSGAQNVRFLSDDNVVGSFPIGFNFHYYWYDVSQFWVGSNGYIGFTNGLTASPFPNIPLAGGTNNYIGAMTSDLVFNSPLINGYAPDTAECWRWSNAAGDTLIVSYINVPFYLSTLPNYTGNNTFQIILSAVDSSITFQYKEQIGTTMPTAGNVMTMGIENNSGNIGLMPYVNTYPIANFAIKFYYPANTTYQVSDAATMSNNNPETGGQFISDLTPSPYVMNTTIKNTGNQNLSPFNVFSRVMDNVGGIQVQQNMMSNALTPGQTQNMSMTTTWNPTTSGTYTYQSNTQSAGDLTPSNNSKIQELQVVDTTTANIRLSYDSGISGVIGGLSWTGGNGGAGYYFVPPFYPCYLTQLHSYIEADPNAVGFSMEVYDDNGVAGAPGSYIDSVTMAPGTVLVSAWNTLPVTSPIYITSGGVYVAWSMNGLGVALAEDSIAPFSNRTFEVVNGTWANYRSRDMLDFLINVTIQKDPNAGVTEVTMNDYFGEFSPNPASSFSVLNYDLPADVSTLSYEIYDVQGKLIQNKNLNHEIHNIRLTVNSELLNAGIYTCKINVDGNKVVRKLVVMK